MMHGQRNIKVLSVLLMLVVPKRCLKFWFIYYTICCQRLQMICQNSIWQTPELEANYSFPSVE